MVDYVASGVGRAYKYTDGRIKGHYGFRSGLEIAASSAISMLGDRHSLALTAIRTLNHSHPFRAARIPDHKGDGVYNNSDPPACSDRAGLSKTLLPG